MEVKDQLIVALDVPSEEAATDLIEDLAEHVGMFKVGLQLFSACGPSIVERIKEVGSGVFLDLKLHDIPNTVASAVMELCRIGIDMTTLHTQGGGEMLAAAAQAVDRFRQTSGRRGPALLGVTVLTSLDQEDIRKLGYGDPLEKLVLRLARLGRDAGVDGLVCSPLEVNRLRQEGLKDLFLVTPGIRPASSSKQDQSRVQTPAEAIRAGATHLVIGRPVTQAPDPRAAARSILAEMSAAKMD